MNKPLLALAALVLGCAGAQAQIVTQWNFNSVPPDSSTGSGSLMPSVGSGSASLVGGVTSPGFSSGTGSSDAAATDNSGWQTTTYAAPSTGDLLRGVQFAVSTLGFSDVVVTWDQRHSNTSSRFTQFQYSLDGSSFTSFGSPFEASSGGDLWYNGRTVDLSSVAGVSNNASFAFRIVATFAPGTGTYAASTIGSNYAATGTNRFDMVTVSAIPEPGTYLLMLAGLGAVGFVAARRRG